jgi:MoaA/NifB/PqqE/SkfB family radical SAM enzyme
LPALSETSADERTGLRLDGAHENRSALRVVDPARRLPPEAAASLARLGTGTVVVPDRGVPIHPASVAKVAAVAGPDRPLCFVPEIPVASDLGLPRYEPVLAWFPGNRRKIDSSRWLPRRIFARLAGRADTEDFDLQQCQRVALTSQAEQLHYFVDHYAAICPNPIQVSVIVSNTCNLHCVMCPYHSRQIKPTHRTDFFHHRRLMTWEVMEQIAAECGSMRVPVKIGNVEEPLMHPRIVGFVSRCRRSGVPSVHITTNGTLLTPQMSQNLLEAGLTSVYVSLDAARPGTYQRIRQGDLDRVERNVRAFLAARRAGGFACRVMVSLVRNEGVSEREEEEFIARWFPETDGVILYHLARYEDGNSRFAAVHEVAKSKVREAGRRWPCLNPWQEIYLLPDGRAYYCCETVSKLAFEHLESMGRYPRQSLQAIWHGEVFRSLRRDLIGDELGRWSACFGCGIWMAHVTEATQRGGRKITRNMTTEIHEHV